MSKRIDPSKITRSRASGFFLVLFIIGLYVLQNKAVVPLIEGVAKSDVFEETSAAADGVDHSEMALTQCNQFVKEEMDEAANVQFGSSDSKAWEIANGRYLVRSQVQQPDPSGKLVQKNFACNVQFAGGDDGDHKNWNLEGLEMRDL